MPMTFVYGPDSVRYKITVLKLEPVVAGHTLIPVAAQNFSK